MIIDEYNNQDKEYNSIESPSFSGEYDHFSEYGKVEKDPEKDGNETTKSPIRKGLPAVTIFTAVVGTGVVTGTAVLATHDDVPTIEILDVGATEFYFTYQTNNTNYHVSVNGGLLTVESGGQEEPGEAPLYFCVCTDLLPGTEYTISIFEKTLLGDVERHKESIKTVDADIISEVIFDEITSDSVSFKFNSVYSNLNVYLLDDDNEELVECGQEYEDYSINYEGYISGLSPDTIYVLDIKRELTSGAEKSLAKKTFITGQVD